VEKPKKKFVNLSLPQYGPQIRGYGGNAYRIRHRGEVLVNFLDQLRKRIEKLGEELNHSWETLDKSNLENPANRRLIQGMLMAGSWAYAQTQEIQDYAEDCAYGVTNPLQDIIVGPLEKIYTKCFAAADLFGLPDESMIGRRGLLTDFEINGGIDNKSGDTGPGFYQSLIDYYLAYFEQYNLQPIAYQKFGELMLDITALIKDRYPKAMPALVEKILSMMEKPDYGFGTKEITSPAKTELLLKLGEIVKLNGNRAAKAA